jgi:membrane protein
MAVRPTRMASSLSYYALFALVPVLVITFWLGSVFISSASLQTEIIFQVSRILGTQNSGFIQTVFANVQNIGSNKWEAIVAVLFLLLLAVTGMNELKQSLDDMFETPYDSDESIFEIILKYGISFLATVGFAIVFIAFIIGSKFINEGFTLGFSQNTIAFTTTYGAPFILFVISTFIAFLAYAFLPERKLPKLHLLVGASITGIFLTIGNIAVEFYLAHSSTVASYGIAGSIVAILLWFYYSSLIFLFGASATWTYYEFKKSKNEITLLQ